MPSREFQHKFGTVAESLNSGESITVTKRGRIIGTFIKAGTRPAPDYLANLDRLPAYPARIGQKIIDEACALS